MTKNNSDNVFPDVSACASNLPHLDRIWEFSSLSYTDTSLIFLHCFFLFLSMFDFFLMPFFLLLLRHLLYFFIFIHSFSCLFAFSFYCLFAFDLCLVVQDHLIFLSFSVHRMLYYKVTLGTKGRPNLRTCDAFECHGDLFIYYVYLEKL